MPPLRTGTDPLLLIPGPVTTRPEVRAAMARDFAPWDRDYVGFYADMLARIPAIAQCRRDTHVALPLSGSGHFIIEAAIRTFVPHGGRILIPMTGAYATRMARLARDAERIAIEMPVPPDAPVAASDVAAMLAADPSILHVGLVHSETSSGVVHDPEAIGAVVRAAGRRMIVDAVSSFGALPLDLGAQPEIEAALFTANKCLEGLPGLSFAVARRDRLLTSAGNAGSWSLDLADVYANSLAEHPGASRFTPPAQAVAAFAVALDLFEAEGGQPARLARYRDNASTLYQGIADIGLVPYLPHPAQGPIVVNVHAPGDPAWSLLGFVEALKERGFVISNFFNTERPSFRVGCIGAITPDDMRRFVAAADAALSDLGIRHRAPAAHHGTSPEN